MPSETPNLVADHGRLGAIDGFRAMAMLMVYQYHVWQFADSPALHGLGSVINFFPAGVDLFMVLSGFCLFWPIATKPRLAETWSAGNFAMRRIRRIVPPYYAAIIYVTLLPIALVILYRLLGQPAKWQVLPDAWQYITHFLFIHTLFPSTWNGIQGVFWSLGLEAQFYLVFPLVVIAFRKFGIRVAWAMIGISIAYRIVAACFTHSEPWNVQFVASIFFLGRWMQFAAGMLAAWTVARGLPRWMLGKSGGTVAASVALGLYLLSQFEVSPFIPSRDVILAGAFGLAIIAVCGSATPLRHLFDNPLSRWLGYISYSIFLIHQNTAFYISESLKKVLHLGDAAAFLLLITLFFVIIVAISQLFFWLFERPFMGASATIVKSRNVVTNGSQLLARDLV